MAKHQMEMQNSAPLPPFRTRLRRLGICAAAILGALWGTLPAGAAQIEISTSAHNNDHAFVLEVQSSQTSVAYHGECRITDGLGATRSREITGISNNQHRFVGTGVYCDIQSQNKTPLAATLYHRNGQAAASSRAGSISIMAQ